MALPISPVTHDPRRVHPPASEHGFASIAEEEYAPQPLAARAAARSAIPSEPRTKNAYKSMNSASTVSVALGDSGMPHEVVWVYTRRIYRNQGNARTLMEQVIADFDIDSRASKVIIDNVEQGTDPVRLAAFFESLGYVKIEDSPLTYFRAIP